MIIVNFIVVDSNGNNIECDIIGLFSHEDKNFIIYTESSLEKEKDVTGEIFANGDLSRDFKVYFREEV